MNIECVVLVFAIAIIILGEVSAKKKTMMMRESDSGGTKRKVRDTMNVVSSINGFA